MKSAGLLVFLLIAVVLTSYAQASVWPTSGWIWLHGSNIEKDKPLPGVILVVRDEGLSSMGVQLVLGRDVFNDATKLTRGLSCAREAGRADPSYKPYLTISEPAGHERRVVCRLWQREACDYFVKLAGLRRSAAYRAATAPVMRQGQEFSCRPFIFQTP